METERKSLQVEFKATVEGEFRAIFSSFDVIDHDGDVTKPGAFEEGQEVKVASWGHDWGDLPVGKGIIHSDEKKAWIDGQFFLDTTSGLDTYTTVKNLGNLQEWSYGFHPVKWEMGEFEEQEVRFLKKVAVHEVSPVMLGAGLGTRTVSIKAGEEKPYPNEHACRLKDPNAFEPDSFRRTSRVHEGKKYDVIMGRLKDETTMTEQAYRYPKDTWSETEARAHCKDHGGRFEAAEKCKYCDEAEDLLASVRSFVTRTRELASLRAKDGRVLSTANREGLKELVQAIASLNEEMKQVLADIEPQGLRLYADFQHTLARLNGVAI